MIEPEDMEKARQKAIDDYLNSEAGKDFTDQFKTFLSGSGVGQILKRIAESIGGKPA